MAVETCPADVVNASVDKVWSLLAQPSEYDRWWEADTARIDPAWASLSWPNRPRRSERAPASVGHLPSRSKLLPPRNIKSGSGPCCPWGLAESTKSPARPWGHRPVVSSTAECSLSRLDGGAGCWNGSWPAIATGVSQIPWLCSREQRKP